MLLFSSENRSTCSDRFNTAGQCVTGSECRMYHPCPYKTTWGAKSGVTAPYERHWVGVEDTRSPHWISSVKERVENLDLQPGEVCIFLPYFSGVLFITLTSSCASYCCSRVYLFLLYKCESSHWSYELFEYFSDMGTNQPCKSEGNLLNSLQTKLWFACNICFSKPTFRQ